MTSIRRRCEQLVKALDIPDPFEAELFYAQIGTYRRKKLLTLPVGLRADGPSGFWIGTATTDYIVYEKNTSPLHRMHIILHEVGHILCDHQSAGSAPLDGFASHLDDALVERLLAREHGNSTEEQEAELIAYLIHSKIAAAERSRRPSGAEGSPSSIERIAETFI
jgi:hypothetical protein